jgi:hypothetical protein
VLGLDGGTPFDRSVLPLADTLGPHFVMMNREPIDRLTRLRRGVALADDGDRKIRSKRGW